MHSAWPYRILSFFGLLLINLSLDAQPVLQTLVTSGPVTAGEPFQVQYVMEDTDEENEFFPPDFKDFRFISGPNIYTGSALGQSGPRKLRNIVYTLAATKSGKWVIPGASLRVGNRLYRSNNVSLQIISPEQTIRQKKNQQAVVNEDIYLNPGEDAQAKIRRNLFMKVLVDKRACFVGEPVTAVFKLYSRLDSRSDIVKNPGFYGFTVLDMINLDSKQTATEIVDGKNFDVHIVRKVQLYPLSAGMFQVDPMEVKNRVRFSRSAVNRVPEQEIIEGVVPYDAENEDDENSVIIENEMSTVPVTINVKPLPEKNRPAEFNGATGKFQIHASLLNKEVARNQEGELVITLSGLGNFSQISAPVIRLPEGIDVFEPVVKDSLDSQQVPLKGKREFHYRFVANRVGTFKIPSVNFSYFNPDSNTYSVSKSGELELVVDNESRSSVVVSEEKGVAKSGSGVLKWVLLTGGLVIAAIIFFMLRKREKAVILVEMKEPQPVSVDRFLRPARVLAGSKDRSFYMALRVGIWNYFSDRFSLQGSRQSRSEINLLMRKKGVDQALIVSIMELLDACDTGEFGNVQSQGEEIKRLDEALELLKRVDEKILEEGK